MFLLAKTVNFILRPGLWIGVLLLVGTVLLWTRWRRTGRWILTVTVAFIVLVTVFPAGQFMIATLENRFPVVTEFTGPVDGIIVLGGAVEQLTTKYRGQPSLTGGAERMTEFVALAKRYPQARLLFSGGSGLILHEDVKETDTAKLFFNQMGLNTDRVMFEDKSRNTFENAVYSYQLAKPKPEERWVLITSASHMPRSVGTFSKAGWRVVPFPVDFATRGPVQWRPGLDMINGLKQFGTGLRAWVALVTYRLLDRSDVLFPAPHMALKP